MPKQYALFVDDDPGILAGLRRMLRSLRHEWRIEFAESGDEAVKRLAEKQFNLVVSDMRMPGMNGAQLLAHVRDRQPNAVRVMLTGQPDADWTPADEDCAHIALHKPCEPERLRTLIADVARNPDEVRSRTLDHATSGKP